MRPYEAYLPVLHALNPRKNASLLDVGCGTGYFLRAATQAGIKTWGVDFSSQAVKLAKKVTPQSKISQAAVEKLPFARQQFDYVVCLGCLQYFPKMVIALQEMRRVAKPKALFCLTMPNRNFIFWRLRGQDTRVLWGIEGNLKTKQGWKKFLEENGLQIEKILKDPWVAGSKKKFVWQLIWRLLPSPIAYQHLYLCRRR